MPSEMRSSTTDDALAAFLAEHPGLRGRPITVIDKLLNRDIEAILARLDKGIPELHQRMDALLERAVRPLG